MIDLQQERETRRATLAPWRCDGPRCTRMLMMLDWDRPSFIQIKCPSCGHLNTFVEAHRPV